MDEPLALIKKMHQETEETEDKNRKTPVRHLQVTAFNKLYSSTVVQRLKILMCCYKQVAKNKRQTLWSFLNKSAAMFL